MSENIFHLQKAYSTILTAGLPSATVMPNHSLTQLGGHPVLMGAYGLVFLLSVVLNGFALWVYFCQARLHTGVTVYLQNLAAADFFLSLSLPLRIANYATDSTTLRQAYCSFGAAAFYLNMYVSILFMEYIAANRYLKIVRPMENHRVQTVRAARYIALGTWASLLTLAVVYVCLALQTSSKDHKEAEKGPAGSQPEASQVQEEHAGAGVRLLRLLRALPPGAPAVHVHPVPGDQPGREAGALLPEGGHRAPVRFKRLPGSFHILHLLQGVPRTAWPEDISGTGAGCDQGTRRP